MELWDTKGVTAETRVNKGSRNLNVRALLPLHASSGRSQAERISMMPTSPISRRTYSWINCA